MKKYFKSLFAIVILPLLMLLTGCNSEGTLSESTVKLERIDIAASPIITKGVSQLTLALGNTQPFEAVGHYSDGSSRILTDLTVSDWRTTSDVGRFDEPNVFTATNVGNTTLTATKDGVTSNTVDMNVSAAEIRSIQVTPPLVNVAKGQTKQFTATAIFTDDTSSNVSKSVTWISADSETATVSSEGELVAVKVGTTTLTASMAGVTSNMVYVSAAEITSIEVTPSPVNVAKGQTQQLTATAILSDGPSSDVSGSVTWISVDSETATVSPKGALVGVKVGTTTLTASMGEVKSDPVDVDVSAAEITSIEVTPSSVNVVKGHTQQLTATAIFNYGPSSNVSKSVTWISADSETATVSSEGELVAVKVGTTTLTASMGEVKSDPVDVDVSAAEIISIIVTPPLVNVAKDQTKQLTATAIFTDDTSSNVSKSVTWISADSETATVTPEGVLVGVKAGSNTTFTATKDSITSNAVDVNVCANFAGLCIDIFDIGGGKLFTNSPSVSYLDSIGGSGATSGTYYENGTYGPSGHFYRFNWTNATELCITYNIHSLGGRANWRLATRSELKEELYDASSNMFEARAWPAYIKYWSATPADGSRYYIVDLSLGYDGDSSNPRFTNYASCVSNP